MEDKTTQLPISEDLSRKITSLAAGEAHTIALTGDGCVYSWGRGMFGRIGTGRETDELVPARVEFEFPNPSAARIVGIAAGAYHSLAVSGCFLLFDRPSYEHKLVFYMIYGYVVTILLVCSRLYITPLKSLTGEWMANLVLMERTPWLHA
ncbi:hypothetical protein F2Q68_00007246 [Brassica cretica]|uniref:Regulator of chromosome condensation 1/beta-lactamase-inhibitor protein II n=1 Tax=Brassica cretica TaxID=69181 RepID=A0A8S9KRA8_BRACR|nr:hypothetical protein F2Q68_00007246 [Brassica cretica]